MVKFCQYCKGPIHGRIRASTKYCSGDCANKSIGEAKAKKGEANHVYKSCPICASTFKARRCYRNKDDVNYDGYNKFCSTKCGDISRERVVLKLCECCGIEFDGSDHNNTRDTKFCSKRCNGKMKLREKAALWKGGFFIQQQTGYKFVLIESADAETGAKPVYKTEQRIVVEAHIKRTLNRNEIIVHLDGVRLNNEISNLYVCSRSDFIKICNGKLQHPKYSNLNEYK
jgi:hypothetical protein